jgi:hypothetical protein
VKELWYHHTLLRDLWPPVMTATGDQAHDLSDLLGHDHDLAMLAGWMREHVPGADAEFYEAVERRRGELQTEAFALGARVYGEKPTAFVTRLERLWHAKQTEVRAP